MARKWERSCFLKREVTQLQKWMVSVFPSTPAHVVHQQPGTHVETMGDVLEVKLCKTLELPHCHHQTNQIHLLPPLPS